MSDALCRCLHAGGNDRRPVRHVIQRCKAWFLAVMLLTLVGKGLNHSRISSSSQDRICHVQPVCLLLADSAVTHAELLGQCMQILRLPPNAEGKSCVLGQLKPQLIGGCQNLQLLQDLHSQACRGVS